MIVITVPKRYLILGALAITASLTVSVIYLTSTSQSDNPETIRASDSCNSLSTDRAIAALNAVLPDRSDYSFDEEPPGSYSTEASGSFSTSCFVRSEQDLLLSARARMMTAEPPKVWENELLQGDAGGASKVTHFEAGVRGVVSLDKAAAFVPCVPEGKIPGGSYNLSVVVDLKKRGDASEATARKSLIDLTVSAAAYAHKVSKCTLPSRI
ncbi:hypothetical protein [Streptomyces sp. NPDC029674]|uniref:hypothetical protein n=1 Tax=Streptomyces sp. NPDC029674 TaxID=3365297 RepID=UPI00384FAC49